MKGNHWIIIDTYLEQMKTTQRGTKQYAELLRSAYDLTEAIPKIVAEVLDLVEKQERNPSLQPTAKLLHIGAFGTSLMQEMKHHFISWEQVQKFLIVASSLMIAGEHSPDHVFNELLKSSFYDPKHPWDTINKDMAVWLATIPDPLSDEYVVDFALIHALRSFAEGSIAHAAKIIAWLVIQKMDFIQEHKAANLKLDVSEAEARSLHEKVRNLQVLADWLKTGTQVVEITIKSMRALQQVHRSRAKKGKSLIRWGDLPLPGHPFYGKTVMFTWQDVKVNNKTEIEQDLRGHQFQSVEPEVEILPGYRNQLYTAVKSIGIPFDESIILHGMVKHKVVHAWNKLVPEHNAFASSINIPMPLTPAKSKSYHKKAPELLVELKDNEFEAWEFEVMAANALAALNSEIIVVERKVRKKRKKKERGSRNSKRNNTIRLDEGGLRTWVKQIQYLDQQEEEKQKKEERDNRPKQPVPFKYVPHGQAKRWVLKPSQNEQILGTKRRIGKKDGLLYLVTRKRTHYTRGQEINPPLTEMKCGADDLLVRPTKNPAK